MGRENTEGFENSMFKGNEALHVIAHFATVRSSCTIN